jgi:hypothetical protein
MAEAGRAVGEVEQLRDRGALVVDSEQLVVADPDRLDLDLLASGDRIGLLAHDGTLDRRMSADRATELAVGTWLFLVWAASWTWKRNPHSFGGIR